MAGDWPTAPIHILCAADAQYGAYAGIMLGSVFRGNPSRRFHVHLLSDGIRRADLRKLAALAEQAGSRCTAYDVAPALAGYRDASLYISRTAYARLLLADFLPPGVDRIIYLDCDMICQGDLAPLWQLAATVPLIAAVPDRAGAGWQAALGLPPTIPYCNSGMLVINVEAWRRRDLGREILAWVAANPDHLRLADQDAINACLGDAITPLPDTWNLQIGADSGPMAADRLAGAALLHYTGNPKPWRFRFRGLGGDIFRLHKRGSPWRRKPPSFLLTYRLRKSLGKRRRAA